MEFEWDPAKNAANVAKHGIDFEDVVPTFFEGLILERIDVRKNYGEVRIQAFGLLDDDVLTIVYTMRDDKRRIISARMAKKREREKYRKAFPRQFPPR